MIEPLTADTRTVALDRPLDLRLTMSAYRFGRNDPTILISARDALRASRTPEGPATLRIAHRDDRVMVEAWGAGREWALDQVPDLLGARDTTPFDPHDDLVADLHRRLPGLRIGRTDRVLEAILPTVCAQRVTGFEAKRAYRQIVDTFGEPAPGPETFELVVPPDARTLANTAYQAFHPLGLERKRADIIRRAAARAQSLEAIVGLSSEEADLRLRTIAGIGTWSVAKVSATALGDPDAVPTGDYNLPNLVSYAFTGERHGSDARMLELLEPFAGHRGRVLRLLKAAGLGPPRRGARMAANPIADH